ncbi:MAG: hypothetical protein ABIS45_13695 [Burkholderiales bacterium]
MDTIGESGVVFSVTLGQNDQWNVTTQEFLLPLASFSDPQTACEWAVERAKPMRGHVLIGDIPVVVG